MDFTYGMENTEMIVVENSGGKVSVTDYYSKAFEQPSKTISNTFSLVNGATNSSGIFATFKRSLKTGNSLNKVLEVGLVTPISFAYLTTPNKGFSRHNNIGKGLLVMGSTSDTSTFIAGDNIVTPSVQLDSNFGLSWIFTSNSIIFTFQVNPI
jgi:hypothetical protein